MTPLERATERAIADLKRLGVDFAVVGGLAVAVRGYERTTKDVDLSVAARSDEEAERVVLQMLQIGYRVESLLEITETGRIATVRLLPPMDAQSDVLVDLLFATCGIEGEVVHAASFADVFPGMRCKVASRGHLIAMKVLSGDELARGKDKTDLYELLRKAPKKDIEEARNALDLMRRRGFGREKNLAAEFEAALAVVRKKASPFREKDRGAFLARWRAFQSSAERPA